jgi:phosphate transport system substrate-binding protein
MKRASLLAVGIIVCLLGFLTSTDAQSPAGQTPIRIKGSLDMAGRVDRAAKTFMKDHPGVTILVSGGSRGQGFQEFLDRTCEVVMMGHHLGNEEGKAARDKGIDLAERLVGYGGLAFLTYPENNVAEVTLDQLQKLIRGDYQTWSQVGGSPDPVTVVSLDATELDTRAFLLHDFLGVTSVKSKVERMTSYGGIIKKVGEIKGSIGYCRIRDLEEKGSALGGAKVLKIKENADSPAVAPTRETIAEGVYPLKRPFSLLYDSKSGDTVKQFVEFVASLGWGGQGK